MTQLLSLDVIETPTPSGQYVPSDGEDGPGRIAVEDLAAAGVTLQTAYNNGASITVGGPGTVIISAESTAAAALSVTKDTGSGAIAGFIADYAGASVVITNADGSLTVRADEVTTSASRLELGAGGVARAAIEGDQLRVPEGTAAAPGLAGDGTPGTGVRCASSVLGLSVAGTERAQITANGVLSGSRLGWTGDADTYLTATGDVVTVTAGGATRAQVSADGVLSAARLGWTGDPDTYVTGAGNVIAFTTGGTERAHVWAGGIIPATTLVGNCGDESSRWAQVWQGQKAIASSGTSSLRASYEVTTSDLETTGDTPAQAWTLTLSEKDVVVVEAMVAGVDVDFDGAKDFFSAARVGSMAVESGTAVLGTVTDVHSDLGTADVDLTVSGASIRLTITGIAARTIRWVGTVRYQIVRVSE